MVRIGIEPEIVDEDGFRTRHFVAYGFDDNPCGKVTACLLPDTNGNIGHGRDLEVSKGAPPGTLIALLRYAAHWLAVNKAVGVQLRVSGKNLRRYRRIGFVPSYGLPMLVTAPLYKVFKKLKVNETFGTQVTVRRIIE